MATTSDQQAYEIVGADQVPPPVSWAAQRTLLYCERNLGLPPVRIIWIRPTHMAVARMEQLLESLAHRAGDWNAQAKAFVGGPMTGQVLFRYDDQIMVRSDLSIEETIKTVAHECRHLDDARTYRPPQAQVEHDAYEASARTYEVQTFRTLNGGGGGIKSLGSQA